MKEVLQKLLDNVNLGKALVDIGPGFLLAVASLLWLGAHTGISVLPADEYPRHTKAFQDGAQNVKQAKLGFGQILQAGACPGVEQPEANANEETLFIVGRRALAALAPEVDSYHAARKAKPSETPTKPLPECYRLHEKLAAQKDLVDEKIATMESAKNKLADSRSLEMNLVTFTNNISLLVAFSVAFAVLLSQLSQVLFVRWLYTSFLPAELKDMKPSIDQTLSKEDDELVKNYYRYMEAAINMVLPVLLIGYSFPAYMDRKLQRGDFWLWALACAVSLSIILLVAGYNTYTSFLKKRKDLAKHGSFTLRTV